VAFRKKFARACADAVKEIGNLALDVLRGGGQALGPSDQIANGTRLPLLACSTDVTSLVARPVLAAATRMLLAICWVVTACSSTAASIFLADP
jgi:hypothetical protein